MTREDKKQLIDKLTDQLTNSAVVYVADTADLDAVGNSNLRKACFKNNIQMSVVKNTLLKKAMEQVEGKDFTEMYDILSGPTSVMFAETGNGPAKMIKEFRKTSPKPLLKAAFIEEAVYIGDSQLDALVAIKSREELIGDIVGLLQSPAKNVISALQSGKHTIAGLVKTLSER